jgi:hypothetical protein
MEPNGINTLCYAILSKKSPEVIGTILEHYRVLDETVIAVGAAHWNDKEFGFERMPMSPEFSEAGLRVTSVSINGITMVREGYFRSNRSPLPEERCTPIDLARALRLPIVVEMLVRAGAKEPTTVKTSGRVVLYRPGKFVASGADWVASIHDTAKIGLLSSGAILHVDTPPGPKKLVLIPPGYKDEAAIPAIFRGMVFKKEFSVNSGELLFIRFEASMGVWNPSVKIEIVSYETAVAEIGFRGIMRRSFW